MMSRSNPTQLNQEKVRPPVLYKYRDTNRDRLEQIIVANKLWANNPSKFNDPFDCFPFIDTTGSYEEAIDYINARILRTGTTVSRHDRRSLAREIQKKGLEGVDEAASTPDIWRETLNSFGVISLSKDDNNILLWSHYAENHTGVCIGFATDSEPFNLTYEVDYQLERPIFRPLAADRTNLMERILLRKASIWHYEEEWRHVRVVSSQRLTDFPPNALISITLGAACSPELEQLVRKFLSESRSNPQLYKARMDRRDFKLHIDRLL